MRENYTYVEKFMPFVRTQISILITKHELNGIEDTGLATAISPDNHIVSRVKIFDHRMVLVCLEPFDLKSLDHFPMEKESSAEKRRSRKVKRETGMLASPPDGLINLA